MVFKALADPNRLRLLSIVKGEAGGESCVCDLTEPLDLGQPTVSHHLKILVDAGLLHREKRGTWAYYSLVPGALERTAGLLDILWRSRQPGVTVRPMRAADWPAVPGDLRGGYRDRARNVRIGRRIGKHSMPRGCRRTGWSLKPPDGGDSRLGGRIRGVGPPGLLRRGRTLRLRASEARGQGIGKALLQALIESTERGGIWTIQASVFPENEASLRLHLAHGFRRGGRGKRIARMPHGPAAGSGGTPS